MESRSQSFANVDCGTNYNYWAGLRFKLTDREAAVRLARTKWRNP